VVFAKADENATADALTLGEDSLWDAAMRIQPYLPLKVNVNYAEIGDVEIDNNEPEVLPDFRKPIVFGMPNGQSKVYELVKQGHSSLDNEAAAFYFTAHLEPHQHQLGFSIWPTLLPIRSASLSPGCSRSTSPCGARGPKRRAQRSERPHHGRRLQA
jgi:hypothetical protein